MPDVISGQAAPAADPVAMISAILDAEKVTSEKPEEPAQPAQSETEAEYVPEQNAQVEGEDVTEKPVAEIPLDQLEAIELETTYKSDDGKDVTEKLPIKALREGYMRQKDYQRKTAELARQRDEVGQKVRQGIEGERAQYTQTLQQLQNALIEAVAPELKNVDWNTLAATDIYEYTVKKQKAESIQQVLQSIKAKQQEVSTKSQEETRQAQQETARKTWHTLESDIPGWGEGLYQKSLKAAESLGFSQGEVGSWLDPRAIKLLHKAHLYDELQAGKPAADKKVVAVPKVIKPGATSTVSPKVQAQNSAMERLRKSGNLSDLEAVLAAKM